MDINDIIKFETESTYCDFKAEQYPSSKHSDFLVDIVSLANADVNSDRYIVIGVKHKNNEEKIFLGIKKDDFISPANYQQIATQNIEPDIKFDYILHELEGKYYGIFQITDCNEQPYSMKKDFGKLKKGDAFIRKGRHNVKMERRDYERIYAQRIQKSNFSGNIEIVFLGTNSDQINFIPNESVTLPSQIEYKRIQNEQQKRKDYFAKTGINSRLFHIPSLSSYVVGKIPYSEMSSEELDEELNVVVEKYRESDNYVYYELNSHKINIQILNNGDKYIEDAHFQLEIAKMEGFDVAQRIYIEPMEGFARRPLVIEPRNQPRYPKVEHTDTSIIISQNIGNIRHQVPLTVFEEPLRIVISKSLNGKIIDCKCKIIGKNLPTPIEKNLKIHVIDEFEF